MSHTIVTEVCEGVADCVGACPVACIHPGPGKNAKGTDWYWIDFGFPFELWTANLNLLRTLAKCIPKLEVYVWLSSQTTIASLDKNSCHNDMLEFLV